jgi:hypothetical protein
MINSMKKSLDYYIALCANRKQHQVEAGHDLSKGHWWKTDVLEQRVTLRKN